MYDPDFEEEAVKALKKAHFQGRADVLECKRFILRARILMDLNPNEVQKILNETEYS